MREAESNVLEFIFGRGREKKHQQIVACQQLFCLLSFYFHESKAFRQPPMADRRRVMKRANSFIQ
jgi:hypothetical protein